MLLCGVLGTAHAGTAVIPTGWTADTEKALSLSQQLGAVPHFGGLRSVVTAEAYRAPAVALYVTRKLANVSPEQRDAAASAELDELRASARRQTSAEPTTWQRTAVEGRLEATLAWKDAGSATESRMIVVADAQHVVAASGECVFAPDAAADVIAACRAALATLDPAVPPAERVALALKAETPPINLSATQSRAPVLSDGGKHSFEPIQVAPTPQSEPDRRPVYVGAGLVVLAAIFWWNRRRRERFEREYEDRVAPPRKRSDDDADDLHAAAATDDKHEDKP